MRLLLDTQVWLWIVVGPSRLGAEARALLEDEANGLVLSAASTWEMAIKYRLGRLPLPEPPATFVPPRLLRDGIEPLSVSHTHAAHVAQLPDHHRDPFDRILVAQAICEGLTLMTADRQLHAYPVEIVPAA